MHLHRWLAPLCLASACGTDAPGGGDTDGRSGPYFKTSMFWNRDVSNQPKAEYSDQWIDGIRRAGGWGNQDNFRVDFSMEVLRADASATMRTFTPSEMYFKLPDCDHMPVPVPETGNIEGETGYRCSQGGDCHLIVLDEATNQLYEMWKANISTTFTGGCLAVWDIAKDYDDTLRGDQCTSADAAGLPIAPLLFTADEVAAGSIDHAIRFIVPNDRVTQGFVRPATHGSYTSGLPGGLPYYGFHLRLRADYPVETLTSSGAQVVARALQKYGMYHADGGEDTLTAQSDRYSVAKWDSLLGPLDLQPLEIEDFEVIDHGDMFTLSNDCQR